MLVLLNESRIKFTQAETNLRDTMKYHILMWEASFCILAVKTQHKLWVPKPELSHTIKDMLSEFFFFISRNVPDTFAWLNIRVLNM